MDAKDGEIDRKTRGEVQRLKDRHRERHSAERQTDGGTENEKET